ncbi:hypothetical protein PG988_005705 [Apiospora saccharicola]
MPSAPDEYIVLADCKDSNNVLQSQMAYYNETSPANKPQDTAVVAAPAGQLSNWFCDFSSGQFTTTGVQFNATLGPKRDEGDYAGNGTNGYDSDNGGYRCWQQYNRSQYKQGQFDCSQVLRCDHRAAPSPLPSISCSAASGNSTDTDPHGLTTGAKIGIGVGSGVGGLILLAIAVSVWRYLRKRRRPATELPVGGGRGPEKGAAYTHNLAPDGSYANYHSHQHPQELYAADARVEADTFSPLGELPANHQQHELETPESRYYAHYDAEGNTLPRT